MTVIRFDGERPAGMQPVIGELPSVAAKRVASKDISRDVVTAVIETANTPTTVKHRLGRKPTALNPLVPMVDGRLYYEQDDLQRWTDDVIIVQATAAGRYPMEVL